MRQTMARGSGFAATLRRRWWIFPIVLVLVAAGLALRALTAPLAVNASVTDGDHAVVRSSAVVLSFNQDMDAASVKHGFHIVPSVPYTVLVANPRTFEFRPQLEAELHDHGAGPVRRIDGTDRSLRRADHHPDREQLPADGSATNRHAAGRHDLRVHQRVWHPAAVGRVLAPTVEPGRTGAQLPP